MFSTESMTIGDSYIEPTSVDNVAVACLEPVPLIRLGDIQKILSVADDFCDAGHPFGRQITDFTRAEQIVEGTILTFDILAGFVGNILVLLTLYCDERFRSRNESVYYVALAFVDMLSILIIQPTLLTTVILRRNVIPPALAITGSALLSAYYFLKNAFNLVLSCNRLVCVCTSRRTYNLACSKMVSILVLTCLAVLHLVVIVVVPFINSGGKFYPLFIPDLGYSILSQFLADNVLYHYITLSYFVLFVLNIIIYTSIFIVLAISSSQIQGKKSALNVYVKAKLKPCLVPSVLFYLTTMPLALISVLQQTYPIPSVVIRAVFVLSLVSSATNPVVYAVYVKEYQNSCKAFLSLRSPVHVRREEKQKRLMRQPWLTREKSMRTDMEGQQLTDTESERKATRFRESFKAKPMPSSELSVQVLVSLSESKIKFPHKRYSRHGSPPSMGYVNTVNKLKRAVSEKVRQVKASNEEEMTKSNTTQIDEKDTVTIAEKTNDNGELEGKKGKDLPSDGNTVQPVGETNDPLSMHTARDSYSVEVVVEDALPPVDDKHVITVADIDVHLLQTNERQAPGYEADKIVADDKNTD